MMPDLKSLIAELEAAKEGSRELDEKIALSSGWTVREDSYGDNITEPLETWEVWEHPDFSLPEGNYYQDPPPYTTSLDAALTLVPEGWSWQLSSNECELTHEKHEHIWVSVPIATLALCIAALKARE